MDLPANLLSLLKCCICDGYLSCGPIYIVEDGGATCGSCSNKTNANSKLLTTATNEVSKIRNIQFEILASLFQFPCRFASFGCPEKNLFSEDEQSCKYEPCICPILSNNQCDWRGQLHHLLEHCKQAHPDNILETPYSSEPNFAESSVTNYIIPCLNTLFFLRVDISLSAERVIYSMYLLDDPSKMALYNFSVDCKRNNLTFSKFGKIGTIDDFRKQKHVFCIISRQVLLMNLGGVAGTTFVINIKQTPKTIKCKFCLVEVDNCDTSEWICNNCEPKLQYCRNNCAFKDINVHKMKKHERYFCKYINKCFDCNGAVTAGKIFQHFEDFAHPNTMSSKIGRIWKASETPRRALNYVLLQNRVIDKMFCKYYLDARQFSLILCTTHSSDQLSLYKCSIEVIDKETNTHKTYDADLVQDFFWDWRIDIDFDDERYELMELDVIINFEKKC